MPKVGPNELNTMIDVVVQWTSHCKYQERKYLSLADDFKGRNFEKYFEMLELAGQWKDRAEQARRLRNDLSTVKRRIATSQAVERTARMRNENYWLDH